MKSALLIFCVLGLTALLSGCNQIAFFNISDSNVNSTDSDENPASSEEISDDYEEVPVPQEFRLAAVEEARRYAGMVYEWGGDDFASVRGIDCSGLVINVYYSVTLETDYSLLFTDTTANNLYWYWSDPVSVPEPGDLIFFDFNDDNYMDHIAIFVEDQGESLQIIDSTQNDSIDGVSERLFPADSSYITAIKRLRVRHRIP